MKIGTPSIYLKLLISTTLSILIALLATSTALYISFEQIALKQVYANDMDTLMQTAKGVQSLTNMAVTLSNQIYSDLNVARLMYYANPGTNDMRTADVQLTNYRLSIPFIESIYVYNGKNKTFYVNSVINRNEFREAIQPKENLDDAYVSGLIDSYKTHKPYQPIPRRFKVAGSDQAEKSYYTFFIYDTFITGDLDRAVIINFSDKWIANYMSDVSPVKNSTTFILDQRGVVVSKSAKYSMMSEITELSFARRVLSSPKRVSFIDKIDGQKFLVTCTAPDEMGWRYVKLTAKDFVVSQITRMKYYTFLIGFILIAIGIVASRYLTKRLYVPIDRLMTTLQKLSLEEKKNVKLLRQVFFRGIFLGRGIYDGQSIEMRLEQLGTEFNASSYFSIVLVKIDNYRSFSQDFTSVDQGLIKNKLMMACEQAIPGNAKRVVLDMGTNGVATILNAFEIEKDLSRNALNERLKGLLSRVSEELGISVSAIASAPEAGIQNLREMYAQTLEASLYRVLKGHGSIIHASDIRNTECEAYVYPTSSEKKLVAFLLAGKIPEAKGEYRQIVLGTEKYPINAFNLMVSRVSFAVSETAGKVRKYNNEEREIGAPLSIVNLGDAETLKEIDSLFYAVFDEIGDILNCGKPNKAEMLVDKINQHIETGYMRQELYIDSIAEFLDKSPAYISHIYKQKTGTTILEKIIEVRMRHAKELLIKSDLSVADISERTGFSSGSYFFKVFRKLHGMTPNAFRGKEAAST
jgi:two-component system, response regulator YesN